jgi:hypothetical protein
MNIRKKKQKHIENCELAHKPTLRKTIRQLLKMFARRRISYGKTNKLLTKVMYKAARKSRLEYPIPEGYSRLEDVLERSMARREGKEQC